MNNNFRNAILLLICVTLTGCSGGGAKSDPAIDALLATRKNADWQSKMSREELLSVFQSSEITFGYRNEAVRQLARKAWVTHAELADYATNEFDPLVHVGIVEAAKILTVEPTKQDQQRYMMAVSEWSESLPGVPFGKWIQFLRDDLGLNVNELLAKRAEEFKRKIEAIYQARSKK